MRITEAAEASGLSADTIRYYEKAGFLPPIERDANGQRRFTKNNVDWMTVLYWLRRTGMPMKAMSRYAVMVHAGDHTIAERKDILRAHGRQLSERRADLDRCEALLAFKLAAYDEFEKGRANEDA